MLRRKELPAFACPFPPPATLFVQKDGTKSERRSCERNHLRLWDHQNALVRSCNPYRQREHRKCGESAR